MTQGSDRASSRRGRFGDLCFVASLLMSALAAASITTASDRARPPSSDPAAVADAVSDWSGELEIYLYLQQDDAFLMPIVSASRGSLHLEGRFQYEDRHTASAWIGWTFAVGDRLSLEIVPMIGAVVGRTDGFAPGLEATLSWRSLELYTEAEYVIDVNDSQGSFLYDWSELTWQALPCLSLGLTAQRTRLYRSDLEVDWGGLVTVSTGPADLSIYAFDLGGDATFVVLSAAVGF